MNLCDLPSGKPFSKMTANEQREYWSHAAEHCRDIVRAEHTTRNPDAVQKLLETIARYAAMAEDPACAGRVDFLARLAVPSVEAVLAAPVQPSRFHSTAVQLT